MKPAALQETGRITFSYTYEGKALTVKCVTKDGTLSATIRVM
jgi:uncharacterized protein YjhX (UPF0386 family)